MTFNPVAVFLALLDPFRFMLVSASYIPSTVFHLVRSSEYSTLTDISAFKDAWFANFWSVVGPQIRESASPRVGPLLQLAHGVVLDIGPGNGEWLHLFSKDKITKIYGVEPNKDHHPALTRKISEAGLEGRYIICPVGVEDVEKGGWVKKGEADSVVTVQCLCSIPEPKKMMAELYSYLKEEGTWIVYEHVVVFRWQGELMRRYQVFIDIFWPHFLGGCSITRDTGRWLKEAGSWSQVDLKQPADEPFHHLVPHIGGILTK